MKRVQVTQCQVNGSKHRLPLLVDRDQSRRTDALQLADRPAMEAAQLLLGRAAWNDSLSLDHHAADPQVKRLLLLLPS